MKSVIKISYLALFMIGIIAIGYLAGNTTSNAYAQDSQPFKPDFATAKSNLEKALGSRQPGLKLINPELTEIDGIVQMQIENGPIIYATENGSHFLLGDLYAVENGSIVNVSERALNKLRKQFLDEAKPGEYISFAPVGEVKAVINVFTDITCGYCRRLHNEMSEINALGIEVRYFAFPRAGVGSEPYHQMVSAWCSDRPQWSITQLKLGKTIEQKTCDNPVAKQYNAGSALGINGTPAIFLSDGSLIPGYRPAAEFAKILGIN